MNRLTMKVSNEFISIALLAMFAVAVIAGQARAGLDTGESAQVMTTAGPAAVVVVGKEVLRYADALPAVMEGMAQLPIHLELHIEAGSFSASGAISVSETD